MQYKCHHCPDEIVNKGMVDIIKLNLLIKIGYRTEGHDRTESDCSAIAWTLSIQPNHTTLINKTTKILEEI
uniref:Uncharacterized protein n=1 Tax=Rhizophora mucronata TaxID=61149 RepID=A0A2P2N417_RHIMU